MRTRAGLVDRAWSAVRAFRQGMPRARSLFGSPWAGAASTALFASWSATQQSANRDLQGSLIKLRARARDLRRNSPIVARYGAMSVDNILGPDGITLQAQVPSVRGINEDLSKKCEAIWYRWTERASLDGRSWDEVCAVLVEAWRIEGETLLEIVFDPSLPFGVGVQALDADLLDASLNRERRDGKDPRRAITMGVEHDAYGRPVAYHVFTRHPSEPGPQTRRVIPADRVCYLPDRTRPGQVRGVTPLASVMYRLQMLNATQEALVDLNHVAARKMGFLTPGADAEPLDDGAGKPPQFDLEPGNVPALPPGWGFTPWDPGQPSQQWQPFARLLGHEIAVGLGVTYSSLFGDLAEASYSSMREGKQSERESWTVKQRQFARTICAPVYAAVLRGARLRGELQRPDGVSDEALCTATWHGRRWDYVDPSKDVAAIREKLGAGLTTLTRELNALGLDVGEVLRERAKELELAKHLGLTLTTDAPNAAPPAALTDDTPTRPKAVA